MAVIAFRIKEISESVVPLGIKQDKMFYLTVHTVPASLPGCSSALLWEMSNKRAVTAS